MHVNSGGRRKRRRVDAGTGDDLHPQARDARRGRVVRLEDALQQRAAHSGAADAGDADDLVVGVPQSPADPGAVGRVGAAAHHVAAEVEVLRRPVPDRGEPRTQGVGHEVLGIAHEHRPISQARVARHVLDHLGVVVGRQVGLALAAVGHRQPADEVGQPGERRALAARVLVQEVVEVPGLVADPEVVVALADQVVEDHEVGDEDLVHPTDRLERVQVVLARLRLDVAALAGQPRRGRVHPLSRPLQEVGDRRLREPLDLQTRVQLAELVGDRQVTTYVPEADRGREVQRPLTSARGPLASRDRSRPAHADQGVVEHVVQGDGVAALRPVAGTLERDQGPSGQLGEPRAGLVRDDPVVGPVHDDDRAPHVGALLLDSALAHDSSDLRTDQGLPGRAEPPSHEVLDQLGRVLLGHQLVEEEVQEPRVVAQPGEPVVAAPVLVVAGVLSPAVERRLPLRGERCQVPDGRCDRDPGGDAVRVVRREIQGMQVAHRQGDHHGSVGPGRVQHVERVLRLLGTLVRRAVLGAVRRPVASWVEGDHPGTTGQVRDLELPDLRRHDAPGREQQHRRVLRPGQLSVLLPRDADAVALDES